jgi:predicted nucleic acid-binding Zn ribbon protein
MQPLQHAIPDVLTRLLRGAPLSPEKVAFAWRAAVGPAMARASSVRLSGEGVIDVSCADDHWRREIRRSLPLIRERLTALLGTDVVRQIKVPAAARPKRRT